jgi:TolA-binding protein
LAQHITRKELKKDEVRETIAHAGEAVLSHQQFVTYLLLAAIIIGGAILGWKSYAQRQAVKAQTAFDVAMKAFDARVGPPNAASFPGESAYLSDKNKFDDAEKKFAEVNKKYPRTNPGQLAAYYAALSSERLDKNDDARKWFDGLTASRNEDFAAMARFQLAQLDDHTGRGDDAVKLYRQLIAKPAVLVPKSVAMLALAEHYSTTNPAEAAKLYTQVKSDYPDTPMAQQAEEKLSLLPVGKT